MSDRAKQFMPFSALHGFYKLIEEKERVIVPKKERSEEDARILSEKMKQVQKGIMLKVVYYSDGEYVSLEGMVSNVDFVTRKLTIVKTKIDFDDIFEIESDQIRTELD